MHEQTNKQDGQKYTPTALSSVNLRCPTLSDSVLVLFRLGVVDTCRAQTYQSFRQSSYSLEIPVNTTLTISRVPIMVSHA